MQEEKKRQIRKRKILNNKFMLHKIREYCMYAFDVIIMDNKKREDFGTKRKKEYK